VGPLAGGSPEGLSLIYSCQLVLMLHGVLGTQEGPEVGREPGGRAVWQEAVGAAP